MAKRAKQGIVAATRIEYGDKDAQGKLVVKVFEPGDAVAMPDEHMKPLLALGAVVDGIGAAEESAAPAA
jgi:hypothetical protein